MGVAVRYMPKSLLLGVVALCALASAAPSDFNNDVILGRRSGSASPCSCISSDCKIAGQQPTNGGVGTCTTLKDTQTCSDFTCNTGWQKNGKKTSGVCSKGLITFTQCAGEPCTNFKAKDVTPAGGTAGDCTDQASWASGNFCTPKCKLGEVYDGQVKCTATKITKGSCKAATCTVKAPA